MRNNVFPDGARVATMHRADAPPGRTARFHLHRVFDHLPCCHRSWANQGKQFFLHGYERAFDIEFACAETETGTDAVVGEDTLDEVNGALRDHFDHTTLIAADDPHRDLFELLADRGVIDLRIMDDTGMAGATAWTFETVEGIVGPATGGRVWVSRIKAHESRNHVVTLTAGPV